MAEQRFLRYMDAVAVSGRLRGRKGFLVPVTDKRGAWMLFDARTREYATEEDCAPFSGLFTPARKDDA